MSSSRRAGTPGAADGPPGSVRATVARLSFPVLAALSRLPRWLLGVTLAAVLLTGLFLQNIAGIAVLSVVTLFVGWLLYLSWPALPAQGRLLRLLVVALLLWLIISRASAL